ncbi:UNVERIFIED_CONTAM: Ankyrin repeat protein SKIP35 [Sesamum radiatum]|uniref:Ankyrin repeat protein SKIP35 n=1 Tax=Sesamum radiatum TaxID=300843 RepID=A0AAW2QG48_SESRA
MCLRNSPLPPSRLHERLQECNGDEVLKAEAGAKVQKFTEWALKCISFHSRCQGNRDRVGHNSPVEIQLQLSAFKTFLDLAGNHLTGKDFTEAFDAACFPLTLFSSSFDPGWHQVYQQLQSKDCWACWLRVVQTMLTNVSWRLHGLGAQN